MPNPITPGKVFNYWNLQWYIPLGGVSYSLPLDEGEPLIISTESGKKVGVLVWHILPPVHLLMSNSTASPSQHIWYAQLGLIPKAAATLTFKDQVTSVFLTEGELIIQVPTTYLSF